MLRLLGGVDWSVAGCSVMPRLGRKPLALLALAATHGARGVARDKAVNLLWPAHDASSGGAALRQCLHSLKSSLGDAAQVIEAQRDKISLNWPLTDVFEFERLAKLGDAKSLRSAAELFRGDFLEGFEAIDGEVARLVEGERLRLRTLARRLVAQVQSSSRDTAAEESVIDLAQRLLVGDPVDEGCHRALMTLLARNGLRAQALAAYDRCAIALRAELDVGPSAETEELARAIKSPAAAQPGTADSEQRTPASAPRGTEKLLFGRDAAPTAVDHMLRGFALFRESTAEANRLARAEAEAASELDPNYVEPRVLAGWTHFFDWIIGWSDDPHRSHEHAYRQAERAFALRPDHLGTYQLRAKLLLWKWRFDEALEQAQAAVAIEPNYGYVHFHLADVLTHMGRHEEAVHQVRVALSLDINEAGWFRTIEAFALYFLGDLEGARRSLESAVTRNPNYPFTYPVVVAVQSELGNYEAARAAAKQARLLAPRMGLGTGRPTHPLRLRRDRDRLREAWGRVGENFGLPADAELALRLHATGVPTPANAETPTRQQQPVTAGALMFPEEAAPSAVDQLLRAWSLLRRPTTENIRLAREAAEAAVRIDHNYVGALVLQGWTHWIDWTLGWSETPERTWSRAVELADRALALAVDEAAPHLLRAAINAWDRRHDAALEHVRTATRIAPDFAHAHHQLANVLMFSGRHAEALQHFRRARALDADDMGSFLQGEATALFMMGELTEARQAIERAITRNPTQPWTRLTTVAIYSDLGNLELARAEARIVAEICPRWRYGVFREKRDSEKFLAAWSRIGLAPGPERGIAPSARIVPINVSARRGRGFRN